MISKASHHRPADAAGRSIPTLQYAATVMRRLDFYEKAHVLNDCSNPTATPR